MYKIPLKKTKIYVFLLSLHPMKPDPRHFRGHRAPALFLLLILSLAGCGGLDREVKQALRELDRTIQKKDAIVARKEARLDAIRDSLSKERDPHARYRMLDELYEEYSVAHLDSAMAYLHRKEDLARACGDKDLVNDAILDKVERYLVSGMYSTTMKTLDSLSAELLPSYESRYYRDLSALYHGLKLTNKDPLLDGGLDSLERRNLELFYRKADTTFLSTLTLLAEKEIEAGRTNQGRELLQQLISSRQNTAADLAILHYHIAKSYRKEGEKDKALMHFAISAKEDLSHGVRASRSLVRVARIMLDRGETRKAFSYITRAYNDAVQADARICMTEIAALMPRTIASYETESRHRSENVLVAAILLAALLSLAIIALLSQRRYQKRIVKYDAAIKRINDDLEQNLLKVKKSDELKEKTLGSYVAMFTDHINALEEYRSRLRVIAKSRDLNEITQALRSDEYIDGRRKALLQEFDRAFLRVYPNFVSELNALLREDFKVGQGLPEGQLNNEIRIFALIRLGVKEPADIARLLKKSPSTIYNYRVKLRKAAVCPKEEFESRLMEIGKN